MGVERASENVVVRVGSLMELDCVEHRVLGKDCTIMVCGMFVLTYGTAPRSTRTCTMAEFDLTGPCWMNEVKPMVEATPSISKQS